MTVDVDSEFCSGCKLCEELCPAVFKVDKMLAKVIVQAVPADSVTGCFAAFKQCPSQSITVSI